MTLAHYRSPANRAHREHCADTTGGVKGLSIVTEQPESTIAAVAALVEPARRELFDYIRRAKRPVGRDEAAAAAGLSRKLAAFHLDKLVTVGLLQTHSEPPGGKRTVGRPPKMYEPATTDVQLSIPHRQHTLLADILLATLRTRTSSENSQHAAERVARERGHEIGRAEHHDSHPGTPSGTRALAHIEAVLARYGFDPTRQAGGCTVLRNCPFAPLVATSADLVCGINHALITGLLEGLRLPAVHAVLEPRPNQCCIQLHCARGR